MPAATTCCASALWRWIARMVNSAARTRERAISADAYNRSIANFTSASVRARSAAALMVCADARCCA